MAIEKPCAVNTRPPSHGMAWMKREILGGHLSTLSTGKDTIIYLHQSCNHVARVSGDDMLFGEVPLDPLHPERNTKRNVNRVGVETTIDHLPPKKQNPKRRHGEDKSTSLLLSPGRLAPFGFLPPRPQTTHLAPPLASLGSLDRWLLVQDVHLPIRIHLPHEALAGHSEQCSGFATVRPPARRSKPRGPPRLHRLPPGLCPFGRALAVAARSVLAVASRIGGTNPRRTGSSLQSDGPSRPDDHSRTGRSVGCAGPRLRAGGRERKPMKAGVAGDKPFTHGSVPTFSRDRLQPHRPVRGNQCEKLMQPPSQGGRPAMNPWAQGGLSSLERWSFLPTVSLKHIQ